MHEKLHKNYTNLSVSATVLLAGVGAATEVDAALRGAHHHGTEVVQHPHLPAPRHPGGGWRIVTKGLEQNQGRKVYACRYFQYSSSVIS